MAPRNASVRVEGDVEVGEGPVVMEKEEFRNNSKQQQPNEHEKTARLARRFFRLTLLSNIFFVIASGLYLALAVVDLDYEKEVQNIPEEVQAVDDYFSWWPYYDHAGQGGQYNDDYVLTVRGDVEVSKYQIIYAFAALCYVVTGIFDLILYPGILCTFLIMAGGFGLASAMFVETDEQLSETLNVVSVHLFLIEAFALFYRIGYAADIKRWVRLAEFLFFLGAVLDVVISWISWSGNYNVTLAGVGIGASCLWLICAMILLWSTFYIQKNFGFEEAVIEQQNRRGGLLPFRKQDTDLVDENSDDDSEPFPRDASEPSDLSEQA